MSVPARAYLSIGEVLGKLRSDFPDVTISKIRFLESEGLIEPQRTPSGYRKFTSVDLERLRYVLLAQRDQYLPLKVIKVSASAFIEQSEMRLSRDELISNSGISEEQLVELEGYGLIDLKGRHYDGDALTVAKVVAEISGFGIEGRHLRAFKTAADREVGLVEQVITPLLRQKNPDSKARAQEVSREIASLSVRLHAALVRSGLNRAR